MLLAYILGLPAAFAAGVCVGWYVEYRAAERRADAVTLALAMSTVTYWRPAPRLIWAEDSLTHRQGLH